MEQTGNLRCATDNVQPGAAIAKEMFPAAVSAIIHGDYRNEGRDMPIVCSSDGEVRGYVALQTEIQEVVVAHEHALVENLMQERQSLQFELTSLDQQLAKQRSGTADANFPTSQAQVSCKLRPNSETKAIEIVMNATEGTIIRCAIITAEQLFGGNESCFVYSEDPSDTLVASFALDKDIAAEPFVCAMIGVGASTAFQAYEFKFKVPKFAMYVPVKSFQREPDGYVTARINERLNRVQMWLTSSFNVAAKSDGRADFEQKFVSLRDGSHLSINVVTTNGVEVTVRGDNMDICGDIIQDLCSYLNISELSTTAEFPAEFANFKEVLVRVEEYNSVRMKLTADMADSTQLVKALVIKAEDARILDDMKLMKKMYGDLYEVNRELIGEYLKRANNHQELLNALKEVNTMIQKAGKLRVGQAKNSLIAECRNAIKTNNNHGLFQIMRTGKL